MAMDLPEARRMLAAAAARPELTAQIVPSPFTLKWDATICRLVRDGYLGRLLRVEARGVVGSGFPDAAEPLHWRQERALSGNNIMMMGIFYEALRRWVGDAASVMVMGSVNVRERARADSGEKVAIDIPDDIDILCRMQKDGALAHLHFSTTTGLADRPMQFWLHGSEGTICLSPTAADPAMQFRGGRRGDAELAPIEVPADEASAWRVEEEVRDGPRSGARGGACAAGRVSLASR